MTGLTGSHVPSLLPPAPTGQPTRMGLWWMPAYQWQVDAAEEPRCLSRLQACVGCTDASGCFSGVTCTAILGVRCAGAAPALGEQLVHQRLLGQARAHREEPAAAHKVKPERMEKSERRRAK